jgi:hypothetical protein
MKTESLSDKFFAAIGRGFLLFLAAILAIVCALLFLRLAGSFLIYFLFR